MKLIIDIPDNQYNQICELRLHNRTIFDDAIRNGIPLDKIRAEINKLPDINPDYPMDKRVHIAKGETLYIIDKYRKEQE